MVWQKRQRSVSLTALIVPGPLTERLHDAYWRFRREGWCCEAIDYAQAQAAE